MAVAILLAGCDTSSAGLKTGTGGKITSVGGAGGGSSTAGGAADSSATTVTGGNTGSTGGAAGSTTASNDVCSGKGPVVTIPATTATTSYQTCTGRIAETRFINALCTCEDTTVAGYLKSRAFNSTKGTSLDMGGSVGINRMYAASAGFTDVGGSLSIAGSDSLTLAGYLKTGSDLRTAGSATVPGYTNVGRNMWAAAGFTDLGPINVTGDLHASGILIGIPVTVGGTRTTEAITVAPPCPCAPSDMLDIAALVAEAKTKNDDAKNGIIPSMFNVLVGDIHATLPCGKFYIEQIAGIGNVIFNVTGRVALFVDGSIANTGNLEFNLSPTAEIDIFIKENLVLTGRATFGQKDRPAASRIYVGGNGDVILTGAGEFVGNVYAPRSLVQAIGFADVYGSIFAKTFVSPGYANFAYDAAITTAGDTCDVPPPPPGTCTLCGTCTGGTACIGSTCGACSTDSDCCSQLICTNGKCVEPGLIY
jgi:hypothetical protein